MEGIARFRKAKAMSVTISTAPAGAAICKPCHKHPERQVRERARQFRDRELRDGQRATNDRSSAASSSQWPLARRYSTRA